MKPKWRLRAGMVLASILALAMFLPACSNDGDDPDPDPTATLQKLPELRFQYANTGSNPQLAEFLQEQLRVNLGVTLVLEPMESKAFSQMVNEEKHTWAFFGWGADYPDPDNWLPEIFGTGGGVNHNLYSDPAFDALATQAMKELDNAKRLEMWADAQEMVVDAAPMVFLFNRERFVLVNPNVQGLLTTGMDGQIAGDQFYYNVSTPSKTLTVNLAGEPAQIDPNFASWAAERSVISQVFEGLLGFNQDLSLKPAVAAEIPSLTNGGISADGKTYTFKINPNATWADGVKVTANDFEYSIKRMLNPDEAAEYASFYYDIVGAEAYNSGTGTKDAVGVKALDASTLEIKLQDPRPTFLSIMALWPAYPLREDIIATYGTQWTEAGNYMGNGPFMLSEWEHQDHMTFIPNPNYWGTAPKLTKITFKMITDTNAALAAYKNNELDITAPPAGTELATLADPVYGKQVVRYNELVTFSLQFNMTAAPFDNKLIRQALSCAIDRSAYIDQIRGGVGTVALSWIPPGMPGYDPDLGKEWDFNPTKAKQLLEEAGYKP
ncbi:MAG: ABC transporter substrate-binding protein [Dehalogenimonas sp.]